MAEGGDKITISEDRLLLVEGQDEVHLFNKLIAVCFSAALGIQVIGIGGKEKLRRNLKAIYTAGRSRPTLRSIAVVRDADADAQGSFNSVCDSVRDCGYSAPSVHGTFSTAVPSIGVFVVPDGSSAGAIETICRQSVRNGGAAVCAETYLDCLLGCEALESTNLDKTFVHSYLAAMRDPVARVGEGALQGIWDFQSLAFVPLVEFIKNLASR